MVFSAGVARSTGGLPLGRQVSIGGVATWKTREFPAAGCTMELALLHHDIHPARWPFYGVARDLLGFEQVINDHGAVGKFASIIARKGLFVRVNVMDSSFGSKGGALGPDEYTLDVGPRAELLRKWSYVVELCPERKTTSENLQWQAT
jgi:hypothetical protein